MSQPWLRDAALLEEYHQRMAKTIAIDFDGVLHPYTARWVGSVPADEPPTPGAAQFLSELVELGYLVVVFSTRADHLEGLTGITEWLAEHELLQYVVKVTHEKPAALAYVDDRAVPYLGSWGDVHDGIRRLAEAG